MESRDAIALRWVALVFLAIGIGAAAGCAWSTAVTLRFISESIEAQGTVVDWVQADGRTMGSPEPGAYHRVIEVESPDGRRLRGEAEVGVAMNQLVIGERLKVRYRRDDPSRIRVATPSGLWLVEIVLAIVAVAFGASGLFLLRQSRLASK